MALDLRGRGITCVVLHPGWVATDMGGAAAPLGVTESCEGLRRVLADVRLAQSGSFFDFAGQPIPW